MAEISTTQAATEHQSFFRSLYFKVIVGIIIGIALGWFYPDLGAHLNGEIDIEDEPLLSETEIGDSHLDARREINKDF